MISTPLCLFDCDAPCDGSTAFVVSHRDYAADAPHPACHVNAVGTALRGRASWDQFDDPTSMAARDAAASMWERTDLAPTDVDVAQLYDGFSILAMVWLEALGFCGRGESGPFVAGGTAIGRTGVLPLNTAGGQLSGGPAPRLRPHPRGLRATPGRGRRAPGPSARGLAARGGRGEQRGRSHRRHPAPHPGHRAERRPARSTRPRSDIRWAARAARAARVRVGP